MHACQLPGCLTFATCGWIVALAIPCKTDNVAAIHDHAHTLLLHSLLAARVA
jgi:hypothetical protein